MKYSNALNVKIILANCFPENFDPHPQTVDFFYYYYLLIIMLRDFLI